MLNFNLTYQDLYDDSGLEKIHNLFLNKLNANNKSLYDFLINNYKNTYDFGDDYASDLCQSIEIAKCLELFLLDIFNIHNSYKQLQDNLEIHSRLFLFRSTFLNKKVKFVTQEELSELNFQEIKNRLFSYLNINEYNENILISNALLWLDNQDKYQNELNDLKHFGAFLFFVPEIATLFPNQKAFFKAKKTNFSSLLNANKKNNIYNKDNNTNYLVRNNFNFYNQFTHTKACLHESNYCVKCHKRKKDTCKMGLLNNENTEYQKNPLGIKLEGCPLNMHISQMHILNETHNLIAALVMITINNPLVAATGNSICIDCEASCIFQKQQAVQTPMVESFILKQILELPWGFEIYSLLTKWNPLRFYRVLPKKNTEKNILISGLGPSGFASAYNLSLEGHNCIAVDMANIKHLPKNLIKDPIINLKLLNIDIETRSNKGFGGVAEYGITSRWNKNYLQVIQLLLAKQKNIAIYGNIRIGSSITIKECIDNLQFDHIVLCNGAGEPNLLSNIDNSLCKGIKTASEFLMVLHAGAYKLDSNIHMQIRLPIVVLGGGLTAVDAATEALLYYKRMLYKYIPNYIKTIGTLENKQFTNNLSIENKKILQEYVEHYTLLEKANNSDEQIKILQELGGCSIVYYKDVIHANAYKVNHKELQKALDQGITFIEKSNIKKIDSDQYSSISSIEFSDSYKMNVRTLILALGTNPNSIILTEDPALIEKKDLSYKQYYPYNYKGKQISTLLHNYKNVGITFLGDMHSTFSGSVVKALASSFYSIKSINQMLENKTRSASFVQLIEAFDNFNNTILHDIEKVSSDLYKIKLKNFNFTKQCYPGHIFKLYNFETNHINQSTTTSKPIFLTITNIDKKNGLIDTIMRITAPHIVNNIIAKKNKFIHVLGPLGHKIEIPKNKNVLLIGEGFTNNSILSALPELSKNNDNTIYLFSAKDDELPFFIDLYKKYTSNIVAKNQAISNILEDFLKNKDNTVDYIIIAVMPHNVQAIKQILEQHKINNAEIKVHIIPVLFCGCKGICGACATKLTNGKTVYGCIKQEFDINEINNQTNLVRLQQNNILEKVFSLCSKLSNNN